MKKFKFLAIAVMLFAVAVASASQVKTTLRSVYGYYHPIPNNYYSCSAGYTRESDCDWMNYGPICTEMISGKPMFSDQFPCANNMTQYYLRSED